MRKMKKLLAAALVLAMSVSLTPAASNEASAKLVKTEQTGDPVLQKIQSILTEAVDKSRNCEGSENIYARGFSMKGPEELAKTYVGELASKYKGLKYAEPVYAGENSAAMVTLASGTMRIYCISEQIMKEKLPADKTLKNVKEIRKSGDTKILVKQVKGKKTTYSTITLNTKMKQSNIYIKNGKKYTKNKKKIKKKTFNKFVNTYKKKKKLSMGKGVAEDIANDPLAFYSNIDNVYYSKDLYWIQTLLMESRFTNVFQKENTDAENPYQAYMDVDFGRSLTRKILAPNVTNPATGKSYQEEEWNMLVNNELNLADLTYVIRDILEKPEKFQAEPAGESVTVQKDDGGSVEVTRYFLIEGDYEAEIFVDTYNGGVNDGKLAAIGHGTVENSPTVFYRFAYNASVETPIDPASSSYCYPDKDFPGSVRTLDINYEGTDASIPKTWTVKAADKVKFDFPGIYRDRESNEKLGGYYLKTSSQRDVPLPISSEETEVKWEDFDDDLNQLDGGKYTTTEKIAKSIYWKEY